MSNGRDAGTTDQRDPFRATLVFSILTVSRECPRYNDFRGKLRSASRNIVLSEILGTPRGIEALSGFIRSSDAFTRRESRALRAAPAPKLKPEDYGGWEEDAVEEEWRGSIS
ncbi:hypothetical protein EXIGLDRAFT_769439 [Exidia glandulosa HHB12029]|uniref:Uncharacterized protein n=1 Tax=Exidia glandulosa HHB12029 TaxID=1314781 RepID=A0A166AHL7_EXIGL|nr:hypothetical protein EXIGLDRAFT_769439 [Exidia glandulosa HHB12029]